MTARRRDRGAIVPMTAIALSALMTMTAFAVDLGRMRTERRDLQAAADAIALDAVQVIAGLDAVAAQPVAVAEANASAARNGLSVALTDRDVQVGTWDVGTRTFTAQSAASEHPDAVQVALSGSVAMFFDLSSDERSVHRRAVAVARAQAQAELGSVLVGIQTYDPLDDHDCDPATDAQLTFMNHLYTELLAVDAATDVELDPSAPDCAVTGPADGLALDLVGWRGLARGRIDLADLAVGLGLGSVEDLLDATVLVADLLGVSADVLQDRGTLTGVQAGTVLGALATHVAADAAVDVGDLFAVDAGEASAGAADVTVNALHLLMATAMVMDGDHFLEAEVPIDLGPLLPLGPVTPRVWVIEPPQLGTFAFAGEPGPRTAQVRIALDVPLAGLGLDLGLLGALDREPVDGSISVVVEAASASSVHESIRCSPEGEDATDVDLRVSTSGVRVGIGTVADETLADTDRPLDLDADLGPLPLLDGTVDVDLGLTQLLTLDLGALTSLSVDVDLLGGTEVVPFTGPFPTDRARAAGSLGTADLDGEALTALDLGIDDGPLTLVGSVTRAMVDELLETALAPVLDALEPMVLEPLLSSLGVTVAGADARIWDVRCQVPALANAD